GSGTEDGRSVACDQFGNVYIAGHTNSPTTANMATPGSRQDTLGGSTDGFLAKFDSSGVRIWGTYYGGPGADQFQGVAIDPWGNVFVAGQSASTINIATAGTHKDTYAGTQADAILVRFDSSGQRLWG